MKRKRSAQQEPPTSVCSLTVDDQPPRQQAITSFFIKTGRSTPPVSSCAAVQPSPAGLSAKQAPTLVTPIRQKRTEQVFLDCGQKNWGQTICSKCGMMYVPGVLEDVRAHQRKCAMIDRGVLWRSSRKQTRISLQGKDDGIILLKPNQTVPIDQWNDVFDVVARDLGMDSSPGASISTGTRHGNPSRLLYLRDSRVIGVLITEPVHKAYRMEDLQSVQPKSSTASTMFGIAVLWTHPKLRGQGIATKLLDVARAHIVFGTNVPRQAVAISSPTTAGWNFFKRYCGQDSALVYDYLANN